MRFKVGDRVRIKSLDWYNKNKDKNGNIVFSSKVPHFALCVNVRTVFTKDMVKYCGKVVTIENVWTANYSIVEGTHRDYFTDEMIEGLVEEETPKFKINDIVFVKNLGWVRITNGYWYSSANEYIYEAIGFNGEGEYDCISQSNIEGQMLPESESENPHTGGNKITLDEYKNNDKEWLFNKLAMLDNITALESIQDIFNHLQQSKYPKTYEECCKVLGVSEFEYNHTGTKMWYRHKLMATLDNLMLCRDAYWKIAGEEMGLGKPWEPSKDEMAYSIYRHSNKIGTEMFLGKSVTFEFPTAEMRDTFYENFKEEIEQCKELL
jgi:hypothetical protein